MATTIEQPIVTEQPVTPVSRLLARAYTLNWEALVYIIIFLLAVFTRFYMLGERVMSHDESLHTRHSWDLYSNGIYHHTPLMHGPILFHATAFFYYLFGDNDFTSRIYTSLLGVGMVMFPLLFRRWLGRTGAILASVMLLISPLILYYNRYIREDTPSIFYTLVMVYCTFMYLDGPQSQRRKARWLYIFSAAMLASLASKEVAFIYIAVFGSFLTLYWLVRLAQHFWRLPGRSLLYTLSLGVLLGGVAAMGMYVVISIALGRFGNPTERTLFLSEQFRGIFSGIPPSQDFSTFINWTFLVIAFIVVALVGTAIWAFRGSLARIQWLDALIIFLLAFAVCLALIVLEERSHVPARGDETAAPLVPGEESGVVVEGAIYKPVFFYAAYVIAGVVVVALILSKQTGWWNTLLRFPEFDILIVMGTLILPWLSPLLMTAMGANPTDVSDLARATQAALPFLPFNLNDFGAQVFLATLQVVPFAVVAIAAGLIWNAKRWLISAAVFHTLFVFFFTTMFTNVNGVGSGMIGSLGYWLEQQGVRRGSQPQYYYLILIMPFYEFLPVIGSILAMFSGLAYYWRFRRERQEERLVGGLAFEDGGEPKKKHGLAAGEVIVDEQAENGLEAAFEPRADRRITRDHPEWLKRVPFLLFVSWWGVFNILAYTLAGEKMPWLGTHLTTPLILLTAWYFGRAFERVEVPKFLHRGWLYLLLIPLMFVVLLRFFGPLLFGQVFSGLTRGALSQTYEWLVAVAGIVLIGYALYKVIQQTGWLHFRRMAGVAAFLFLSLLTFRSAWMASFINYDLATEYLVYAHAAPAIKTVLADLEEMSLRTTDGMNMVFAYDNEVSWPYSWYFRNFRNARYFGSSPSAQQLSDAVAVVVGDGNRALVEPLLEDRYYRFEYNRLWWPMQDYFGLTPDRVLNALDLSPANTQAAQIRQGMWDIWWARDYSTYGQAVGKDFSIQRWPVADRMHFYVRKDVAAQIWSLGVGEGTTGTTVAEEPNMCVQNWDPRPASLVIGSRGQEQGQLSRPIGLAVSPDGRLYVADEGNHRISVFDTAGTFLFSFGQRGGVFDEAGNFLGNERTGSLFERPAGVAVGPSGNVYVADTWNFRVQVFTPQGEFLRSWGQRGEFGFNAATAPEDAFWAPRAIAVDSQERVYVADTGNKRIRVYTAEGQHLMDIGSGGSGVGQLDEPVGLAISPDGLLYVADTWNDRISVFTLDGQPASVFSAGEDRLVNYFRVRGWIADLGNRPYIALDASRGVLYVTDPDAGRVLIYDAIGNCLGSIGQPSRETAGLNQFNTVGGIATDSEGYVYVSDAGNGRVLRFDPYNRPVIAEPGGDQQAQQSAETTEEALEATSEVSPEVEITEEAVG